MRKHWCLMLCICIAGFFQINPSFSCNIQGVCNQHNHYRLHGYQQLNTTGIPQTGNTLVGTTTYPDNSSGLTADPDLHGLLPSDDAQGNATGPFVSTGSGFAPRADQPYQGTNEQPRHVYPGQYQIIFSNGTANAQHGGDSGGVAIVPNAPGCVYQGSAANCEEIIVEGNVPAGTYQYTNHLYDFHTLSDPSAELTTAIRSTGSVVVNSVQVDGQIVAPHIDGYYYVDQSLNTPGTSTPEIVVDVTNTTFDPHAAGTLYTFDWVKQQVEADKLTRVVTKQRSDQPTIIPTTTDNSFENYNLGKCRPPLVCGVEQFGQGLNFITDENFTTHTWKDNRYVKAYSNTPRTLTSRWEGFVTGYTDAVDKQIQLAFDRVDRRQRSQKFGKYSLNLGVEIFANGVGLLFDPLYSGSVGALTPELVVVGQGIQDGEHLYQNYVPEKVQHTISDTTDTIKWVASNYVEEHPLGGEFILAAAEISPLKKADRLRHAQPNKPQLNLPIAPKGQLNFTLDTDTQTYHSNQSLNGQQLIMRMTAFEHIEHRHFPDTQYSGVGVFHQQITRNNLETYINTANAYGEVTNLQGNTKRINHKFDFPIGTKRDGSPAYEIEIFIINDKLRTAYPRG